MTNNITLLPRPPYAPELNPMENVCARAAYEAWEPWLKRGGTIALHNSNPHDYAEGHDGHYRLAVEEVHPPRYSDTRVVVSTTFARKAAG